MQKAVIRDRAEAMLIISKEGGMSPADISCAIRASCEAQGKGRAKGRPRKVTERSFIDMDGGWWLSFP